MTETKQPKKREKKEKDKAIEEDKQDLEIETKLLRKSNKELLKQYINKEGRLDIISIREFVKVAASYLTPFWIDYHREQGVQVNRETGPYMFSVVPFGKTLKTKNKSLNRSKVNFHLFDRRSDGKCDIHRLVLTPHLTHIPNIPLFLDTKERRYLKNHHETLVQKYLATVSKLSCTPLPSSEIPVPIPPHNHRNCIVCFRTYSDYYEHVGGSAHKRKTNSDYYKEYYDSIDAIFEELKANWPPSTELKKAQKVSSESGCEVKETVKDVKNEPMKEAKSDTKKEEEKKTIRVKDTKRVKHDEVEEVKIQINESKDKSSSVRQKSWSFQNLSILKGLTKSSHHEKIEITIDITEWESSRYYATKSK